MDGQSSFLLLSENELPHTMDRGNVTLPVHLRKWILLLEILGIESKLVPRSRHANMTIFQTIGRTEQGNRETV